MFTEETIVAQSTAPGPGTRGIVRLSGPKSLEAARRFFEPIPETPQRFVADGSIHPWGPQRPAPARLLFWPEGQGYTGQQTVELHTIASPPLLEALISGLCDTAMVRLARPGEFTMRAFLAGRLDLPQAEAVLGIIDAKDEQSLAVALDQLAGGITVSLKAMRESLFDALAHLEAGLDFADEDIEFISGEEIRRVLDRAYDGANRLLSRMDVRRLSDEKPRVVLSGPPNTGKSTLFNTLLQADRAIVSSQSGTTRDYLEANLVLDGFPLTLIDTAGFDDGDATSKIDDCEIDDRSRSFAQTLADRADLLLECREDNAWLSEPDDPRVIRLRTRSDRPGSVPGPNDVLSVSSRTGEGIETLQTMIVHRLRQLPRSGEVVPDTAVRCRDFLRQAVESLDRARQFLTPESFFDESLLASEIRDALNHLGEIDGSVHRDDLLDRIFGRFCIGK